MSQLNRGKKSNAGEKLYNCWNIAFYEYLIIV